MASPQADAFHMMVRQFRDATIGTSATLPTVEEMRAGAEMSMAMIGVAPTDVVVTERQLAGRRALRIDHGTARVPGLLLYLHGGAYVMNSIETHQKLVSGIVSASGVGAVVFDYRMAPEHPFPAAVDDALAAYRALLDEGVPASSIIVAGDSAGGGLTIALLVSARDTGLPQPAGAVVLSPWTDLEGVGVSMDANVGVDLMVERATMRSIGDIYLAGADVRSPLASPIYADLHGLARSSSRSGDMKYCSMIPPAWPSTLRTQESTSASTCSQRCNTCFRPVWGSCRRATTPSPASAPSSANASADHWRTRRLNICARLGFADASVEKSRPRRLSIHARLG